MTDDVGILGMASFVPSTIRSNSDPIFDWLRANHQKGEELFTGFGARHVLQPREDLIDVLSAAAKAALEEAEIDKGEIDHVLGAVSPSRFVVPDSLYELSKRLSLPASTLTISINNDFCNFNVALRLADLLVRAARARYVLIAIAGGWSRVVSYTTPQAISAGDGAAACVIGRARPGKAPSWTVIDDAVVGKEMNFGEMGLSANDTDRPEPPVKLLPPFDPTLQRYTGTFFQITDKGLAEFTTFGKNEAAGAARAVIARQGIDPAHVTLIGHQASRDLLEHWGVELRVAAVLDTLAECGNMTVANIPVTLHRKQLDVRTPYVVALALAPDMHAHALLLRRGSV